MTLQARVLDATGKVLATSAVVPFNVNNVGGSIHFVSPDDAQLKQSLRGKVKWEVEADRAMSDEEIAAQKTAGTFRKPIEALLFFIDGKQVHIQFGAPKASVELDTTQWANGEHELFVAAYGFRKDIPPVGMLRRMVSFDNGHAVRDVRARWSTLFLTPDQTLGLAPRVVYTDGTEEPAGQGVTFSSDNPTVASVDVNGNIKGVASGVANVTLEARGRKMSTRVVVDTPHALPHFARDGQILTSYDPARSTFVRTLFFLNADAIAGKPQVAAQLHAASINALTSGFYFNPADSGVKNFETWRKGWEPWIDHTFKVAQENNFNLVFTGDDIARTDAEMHNSATNPWAPQAIQLAFQKARDSKRTILVEMVDEVSMMWGDTPRPTDGRWKKKNPPLDDEAFIRVMKAINSVPNRPPISWPVLGLSGPDAARNWMGDPAFSDYAGIYWTYMDWRRAYPDRASLPQERGALDRNVVGWEPVLQRNQPRVLLTSLTGPFYRKRVEGDEYSPGEDDLLAPGVGPRTVAAQTLYAAATGMAGVRAYGYDGLWVNERKNAKIGASELQTGAAPPGMGAGSDRWQAMASAYHLIEKLELHLLQQQISAIDLGPNFVTGARKSSGSRLFMAVNFSEASEKVQVDLRPYRINGASSLVRYRLCGATLSTQVIPDTQRDVIEFAPGEAVVWLFLQPAKNDLVPPANQLSTPLPDATLAGKVAVTAQANDNVKLARVEFFVDGQLAASVPATRGQKELPWQWDTTQSTFASGWHSLSAVAHDGAGNQSEARIMVQLLK